MTHSSHEFSNANATAAACRSVSQSRVCRDDTESSIGVDSVTAEALHNNTLENVLTLANAPIAETVNMASRVAVPTTERSESHVAARHRTIRRVCRVLAKLDRVFGDRVKSGFGVLMYHRCCPIPDGVSPPTMNVTPEQLEEQLGGLQSRGFVFRSLPDVVDDLIAGKSVDRKTVVVTFDDGFAGVHKYALPVLESLKVPASVFVCTGMLGRVGPMPFDPWGASVAGQVNDPCYRSLTVSECDDLLETGLIDIGAHTHSHADFRGRPDDLYDDLSRCVATLRQHFNIERPTFAFPFGTPSLGYTNDQLVRAAKLAGLQCGVTSESKINSLNDDVFRLGRLNVFHWDTAESLQPRLHGWYSWLPRLSALARKLLYAESRDDQQLTRKSPVDVEQSPQHATEVSS